MATYESSHAIEFTSPGSTIDFMFDQDEITITADDRTDRVLITLTKEEAQALTRFLISKGY